MKQTAVEWLVSEIKSQLIARVSELDLHSLEQQAKAMEKRQMEELALYIYEYSVTCLEERINPDGKKKFEQYYNETYNK